MLVKHRRETTAQRNSAFPGPLKQYSQIWGEIRTFLYLKTSPEQANDRAIVDLYEGMMVQLRSRNIYLMFTEIFLPKFYFYLAVAYVYCN